jgi:hypothetical protein
MDSFAVARYDAGPGAWSVITAFGAAAVPWDIRAIAKEPDYAV